MRAFCAFGSPILPRADAFVVVLYVEMTDDAPDAAAANSSSEIATAKVCPHCATEYETTARFCPVDGTALRPKAGDTLIGHVLADRYHIIRRIGEGGMGRVYLAEHIKMRRQCAVKVMTPSLVQDAESSSRFAREASNAARIIHPNVAAVFDYGESDGQVYLVMEFVDGQPLSLLLNEEAPFAIDRAVRLGRQIAEGLCAAHELGIIHRDLKPDNVLVARTVAGRETVKVVDFGIAKALEDSGKENLTRTGHVVGTPEFMSPEQLLGDAMDQRSDLYALGCILHLMLTGSPAQQASTRELMIQRRLSEDVSPLHSVNKAIPEAISHIVHRLLARSPSDRFPSAEAVIKALDEIKAVGTGLPRAQTANRYTPRSAPTVAFLKATETTASPTIVPKSRPMRRAPLLLAGIGALLVVSAVLYTRSQPDADELERSQASSSDSVLKASLAQAGSDSLALVSRPNPAVAMVDTAASNARAKQQRESDSLARATTVQTSAIRAPIARYANAIATGDVNALRAAFPAMTRDQQDRWESKFFAHADRIAAHVSYGPVKVSGDSAEASFSLDVKYVDKTTKQSMNTPVPQHATLVRRNGAWQIVAIR